VSFLK